VVGRTTRRSSARKPRSNPTATARLQLKTSRFHSCSNSTAATEPHSQLVDKARRYSRELPLSSLAAQQPLLLLVTPTVRRTAAAADALSGSGLPIRVATWSASSQRTALEIVRDAAAAGTATKSSDYRMTPRPSWLPGSSAGPTRSRTSRPHSALAVWPPASPTDHHSRYLATTASGHLIEPDIAARAILAYSDPGELVIDPCCVSARCSSRPSITAARAIGVQPDREQAALASANVSHARHQGAPGRAAVLEGEPDELPWLLPQAAAILNSKRTGGRVRRHPAGSAQLILSRPPDTPSMTTLLSSWSGRLAPGGFLLLVRPEQPVTPRTGLGETVAAGEQAGLVYCST